MPNTEGRGGLEASESASASASAAGRRFGRSGRAIALLATLVLTWVIFRAVGVSVDEIRTLDRRWWTPDPVMLVGASVVLVAGYCISALLWAGLATRLGARGISRVAAARIYLIANLGRYVPGKVWQVLGLAALARRRGVGAALATSSAVLSQALALAGAAVVGAAVLLGADVEPIWTWSVAAVVVALVLGASSGRLLGRALGVWARVLRSEPPDDPPDGIGLRYVALYAVNWVVYAAAFWLFVRSVASDVGFLEVGPQFAAAYLLGYLFLPAPAGLGIREGFLTAFLAPRLGAGAVAVALTSRLWMTLVELVPAALAAALEVRAVPTDASQGGEPAPLEDPSEGRTG